MEDLKKTVLFAWMWRSIGWRLHEDPQISPVWRCLLLLQRLSCNCERFRCPFEESWTPAPAGPAPACPAPACPASALPSAADDNVAQAEQIRNTLAQYVHRARRARGV